MAETTKTASFAFATSPPRTRAATSMSWIARRARPLGLSVRLTASTGTTEKLAAMIQYNLSAPHTGVPKTTERDPQQRDGKIIGCRKKKRQKDRNGAHRHDRD